MLYESLPLARSAVNRDAISRQDPELVARMLASPISRVLLVDGARVAVRMDASVPKLLLVPGVEVAELVADSALAYLGSDARHPYLGVDCGSASDEMLAAMRKRVPSPANIQWASPREVGAGFDDLATGLATTALALMQWHRTHRHCPRCGTETVSAESGWTRLCPADQSQHFPRTDPAVIMAIIDDDDRLLLGRGTQWPERRFSTLAGFVEPGESLENAVRREVYEEASITVGEVTYQGSQPWPFPASLMLAFTGHALSTDITVDGIEMADARWFTREHLASAVGDHQVLLPGRASVARALIEQWYGAELIA